MTEITAEDFGLPEQEYYFEYNWLGVDFNGIDINSISVGASVAYDWQPGSDHVSIEPINTWEPVNPIYNSSDYNTADSNSVIHYSDIHYIQPDGQYPPGTFTVDLNGSIIYIPEQEDGTDSDNS
jgi:hypothetical protein